MLDNGADERMIPLTMGLPGKSIPIVVEPLELPAPAREPAPPAPKPALTPSPAVPAA